MKELNDLENKFLIFISSLTNFESQLKESDYKEADVQLLAFQTINKLKDLNINITNEIKRAYLLKNL
tara:strand:+ start:221 stop:421 length:201 start_codon:yes stop_codon:yes gene_type:complete